uniref:FA_FANCE domain-containing protein n=1 Tax=Strongyloides papillosus TaxID=174720 RepID=A0A0N5BSX8_STREA
MSDSEDEFVSASEGEELSSENSFSKCSMSTSLSSRSVKDNVAKTIPPNLESSSSTNLKFDKKVMDSENEEKTPLDGTATKVTSKEDFHNEGQFKKPVTFKSKEEEFKKVESKKKKNDYDNDWDCDWDNVLEKSSSFKKIEKIYTACGAPKDDIHDELESLSDEKSLESESQTIAAKIQEAALETVIETTVEIRPLGGKNIEEKSEEIIPESVDEKIQKDIVAVAKKELKINEPIKIEEPPRVQHETTGHEEVKTEKVKPRIKVLKLSKKIGKKEDAPPKPLNTDMLAPNRDSVSRVNSSQSSSNGTDISSYEKVDTPEIVEDNDWFDEVAREIITKNEPKKSSRKPRSTNLFDWSAINAVVSSVGDSISNVVESSLGIPSAEEMARVVSKYEKETPKEESSGKIVNPLDRLCDNTQYQQDIPSISGIFSGFVNTSLDALETLGKKTFETLTVTEMDGDRERRKFLFEPEKPGNLSDILKELRNKEKNENESTQNMRSVGYGSTSQKSLSTSFVHLFEKHGGLFNLEGLEMLTQRVNHSTSTNTSSFNEHISEFNVNDISPISMDKFEKELKKLVKQVKVPFNPNHILGASKNQEEIYLESTLLDNSSIETIFENAMDALALLTAESVQVIHKLGQLFSIAPQIPDDVIVIEMTKLFCRRVTYFSEEYANLFNSLVSDPKIDEMVTNIFYESTNATLYIKKAVALLKPFYS